MATWRERKETAERWAAGCAGVLLLLMIGTGLTVTLLSPDDDASDGSGSSTSSPMPQLLDNPSMADDQIQGSWYCWNKIHLAPHRLGHHVYGDHLCTWGELRSSGFAWSPR